MKILVLVLVAAAASGKTVTIECDGSRYLSQFKHVYALDVLYRNESQLTISRDSDVEVTKIATLKIGHKRGIISKSKAFIRATLHEFDCAGVKDLECELFGHSLSEYVSTNNRDEPSKQLFKPKISHAGKADDVNITLYKTKHLMNEVSLVSCSAYPEPFDAGWKWEILLPGESSYRQMAQHDVHVIPPNVELCEFLTVSKLVYITEKPGDVTFRCHIGHSGTASATINVKTLEIGSEILGNTMTLTTMILVYTHFIILPWLFSRWNNVFTYRQIKDSENFFMRKMRTVISYILGAVFFFICLAMCIVCSNHALMSSYLAFAVTEFLFIMAYATMRLLSSVARKMHQGRLKNARIAMSFGSVLSPILFWIVIRINGGVCNVVIEVVFCLFTLMSILGFVIVSFDREGEYWEKPSASD